MHDLAMKAGGREIRGWTSARVVKSMEQFAHEFSFTMVNGHAGVSGAYSALSSDDVQTAVTAIDEIGDDDVVTVEVDGVPVVTGYIDGSDDSYSAVNVGLRVTGVAKTGDLIDCSAIHKTGAWADASMSDIASDIVKPFGLSVSVSGDEGEHFKRFRLEHGESAFEAITRLTSWRSFIPMTSSDGNVLLSRAGTKSSGATLELGQNILIGGCTRSRRERFSDYIFRGQSAVSDAWHGEDATQLSGQVEDGGMRRYRPLVILGAKQRTSEDLEKRAAWERNVRYGRSLRSRYTVVGWKTDAGALWEPNTLVHVRDPWCGIDEDLLLTGVQLVIDERGFVAELDLMPPEAFDIEPPVEKKRKRGGRGY